MHKLYLFFLFILISSSLNSQHSIARQWNEEVLNGIRNDFARPTVHARNLFHSSIVMYDIWSSVTGEGRPYLLGDTIGNYISTFEGFNLLIAETEQQAYIEEAISYASYELMRHRFEYAPKHQIILESIQNRMTINGYDFDHLSGRFPDDESAAALGRTVAAEVIAFGLTDNSNELEDYRNRYYQPGNDPVLVTGIGNEELEHPNRWQPLAFNTFIDQSGNVSLSNIPSFLGAEWGAVTPFALTDDDLTIYNDLSGQYYVYHDPRQPPYLSNDGLGKSSENFIWGFSMVGIWSSMLDPTDGIMWDISPKSIGNIQELPENFDGYDRFYNLMEGGDASIGHPINPVTNEPYKSQMVPRADYARVLAEFWADGPDSETPPGHWFTILHEVMDHPLFSNSWEGRHDISELEYDIKAFFTLGAAMHDAAVTAWGIKGWYDYVRPISVIRYMASKGQSSDSEANNYDPHGLPIIPGYIEVITENDPLALNDDLLVGEIKIKAWKGPNYIEDPDTDVAGVGWIRAKEWWPYQRPTFVSPPFAGYISGHSCFSRAAAEVLTLMTGDEFFPGGMGIFPIKKNEFLVFEDGPSVDLELQWATYRDASDQTSLSRIWGGIHPPQDDVPGRLIGIAIGINAFNKASSYFGELGTSTYDELIVNDAFLVYPNPLTNRDRLYIRSLDDSGAKKVRLELFDVMARKVRSEVIRISSTSLDLHGLSNGSYFLHIIDDKRRQITEVVIVN